MKYYLLLTILCILAWSSKPTIRPSYTPGLPSTSLGISQSNLIECFAFCNTDKPGTAIVRLTWHALEFREADQRIDMTIFKNGFEKKMYSTLWPVTQTESFKTISTTNPERADKELFYLKATLVNFNSRNKQVTAEFEGLRPGINYYFRLLVFEQNNWKPISTAMCEVPICIKD